MANANNAASVSHLRVNRHVAVAQRETGGGAEGPREVNRVLVQGVKNCVGGTNVAHVHDAERRLHAGENEE